MSGKVMERKSIEEMMAEDLLSQRYEGSEAEYQAKLASVKVGRELGFTDHELEESLGITLKAKDRQERQK